RDLGIGTELTNLAALAKAGYAASRRLTGADCISHDPAAGTAALEMLTCPVISTTCTRVPGMRFPDPRVQALLAACCALAPPPTRPPPPSPVRPGALAAPPPPAPPLPPPACGPPSPPAGERSRGHVRRPDQLGLRRLRAHQIIERIPHSRTHQVTADGLSTAL